MATSEAEPTKTADDEPSLTVARGGRNDEPVVFDELGRDAQLLGLIRLISRADPPMVIGVHGDWGAGKTSFMRVLQVLLTADGRQQYRAIEERTALPEPWLANRAAEVLADKAAQAADLLTVWFNPWEHQFEDEPVMPLLDAIRHQQRSGWAKLKSNFKRVVEDPKFRIIGKAALGVAKMVGPGWFSALSRQIGDEARAVVDSFSQFRDEFEKCTEELTRQRGGRLVIFIDDLDRCEAKYVVKILEALKLHLLNRHCIYVLGCAHERVRECLKSQLGLSDETASEYVEKIVQLPVHLPHVWDPNFRHLLEHLGWQCLADDDDCFALLRTFAGDNPRRLKRFLYWYDMERAMVDFVPGLKDAVAPILNQPEALLLKIKLLQFVEPRRYVLPEDFLRDAPESDAPAPHGPPGGEG